MKLSEFFSQIKTDFEIQVDLSLMHKSPDQIVIEDVAIDSRLVKKNTIFFALPGRVKDGADFIDDAVARGASVVVGPHCAKPIDAIFIKTHVPFQLLTEFLKIFYNDLPDNIYAVTGTNGKTSTAEFTRQILEFAGKKAASIGTLGVNCDAAIKASLQNSSLTTPDIVSLYKNLFALKKNGVNDVAMEVSSIGLEQGRVSGLQIDVGAFTNFTQDHLDYHKTMEDYFKSKMLLFEQALQDGASVVLNSDIEEFDEIEKICRDKNHKILEYGYKARDLKLTEIQQVEFGQEVFFNYRGKNYTFDLAINGEFQAFNTLCALGNVLSKHEFGHDKLKNLLTNFSLLHPAPGRMQRVGITHHKAQIFIDFAHTPDALENVLKLARQICKGHVIILLGCGGDRDAQKRSIMGRVACQYGDKVIITDDNPRSEKPEDIRAAIMHGCKKDKAIEIGDRKLAIEKAIAMLEDNDILILAGKGHEKYQIIGDQKFEFDEEKIVKNVLAEYS